MPDHLVVLIHCTLQAIVNILSVRGRSKNRKNKVFTPIQL